MSYTRFGHLAIEGARPAPTEQELAEIERLLGAKLPASFREFLKVANGGYLEYVIDVPFGEGKSEPLSFCSIFSAGEGEFCDETFVGEIRAAREYQDAPPGVLPFARDGGGSIAFLDLSPKGGRRVVAFVEGLPAWAGLRTESAFVELASSFDAYVGRLRIDRALFMDQLQNDARTVAHVDAAEEFLDIAVPGWRDDPELAAGVRAARRRVNADR